jgi:hypothetical protein
MLSQYFLLQITATDVVIKQQSWRLMSISNIPFCSLIHVQELESQWFHDARLITSYDLHLTDENDENDGKIGHLIL